MSATNVITGTGVVPGVAHGPALWAAPRPQLPENVSLVAEEARPGEIERFRQAALAVSQRFAERASHSTGAAAEVLGATAALAKDRGWLKAASALIAAGQPAPHAAAAATDKFVALFEKAGGVMAERATDLRDIRDRVVAELLGAPEPGAPTPAVPSILLADDLAPSDTAGLDPERVVGLVTQLGGPTSHTSIIARQLGIPCIVAAPAITAIPTGEDLLIDGGTGEIRRGATEEESTAALEADRRRRAVIHAWHGPAQTADGFRVQLLANVQDGAGARKAVDGSEAEGVGLFRTELCFLSAEKEPSVEEQARLYREVLTAFEGHKLVLRTLDAGSDKPLKFANLKDEDNPALGVRGLRLAVDNPALLTNQLDAMTVAAEGAQIRPWVMAPMVSTVSEAERFAAACRARDLVPGIMVEVPAVALLADSFLAHVDFLSIGTNDLAQYTMAADRMAPGLAELTDPWQPAVLRLIDLTTTASRRAGKPVGVCGEAAADPLLACILVGLGVNSLSMAYGAIASVGAQLAQVDLATCQRAARSVLEADSASAARAIASAALSS